MVVCWTLFRKKKPGLSVTELIASYLVTQEKLDTMNMVKNIAYHFSFEGILLFWNAGRSSLIWRDDTPCLGNHIDILIRSCLCWNQVSRLVNEFKQFSLITSPFTWNDFILHSRQLLSIQIKFLRKYFTWKERLQ